MRMFRKKDLATLAGIFALLVVVGVAVGLVARMYRGTGLAVVDEFQGEYRFNGKIFVGTDGSGKKYDDLGRARFEDLPLQTLDLSSLGLEGEVFRYYRMTYRIDNGDTLRKSGEYWIGEDPSYEGFWPVSTPNRFVYSDGEGKRYCIHPQEKLCYPMFSDSVEGVDVYGKDVVAFSSVGSYAIGVEGETVRIYQTDPSDDSLRIVNVKTVSLSDYGVSFSFGAFVGTNSAYFKVYDEQGKETLVALNCANGEVAKALLPSEWEYGEVLNRLYCQALDETEEEGKKIVSWYHRLLGERRSMTLPEGFSDPLLCAVSPSGLYAVGTANGPQGEEYLVFKNEKRCFSLSSVLKEGERVDRVDFAYENILVVSLTASDGTKLCRSYKICF